MSPSRMRIPGQRHRAACAGEPTGARAEEHDITEGCEQLVDLGQLAPEFRRGEADARFVVHEVVRQFVAIGGDASYEVGVALRPCPR